MPISESTRSSPTQIALPITSALAGLRNRIRLYVLLQGLAAVVVWLGLTFWAGFALDYLPVLLGASEMPRVARAVVLAAISLGTAVVLYRWLLARLFVPLADRSLAILLERRNKQFQDSLVTSVDMGAHRHAGERRTQSMLAVAEQAAQSKLKQSRLRQVLNFRPLFRGLLLATLLVISIVAGFAVNASAMSQAVRRLYTLDDTLWQRFARIELIDLQVRHGRQDTAAADPSVGASGVEELHFDHKTVKVARGANLTLRVRAAADAQVVPEQCYLSYRTADGDRGTATMKRVGKPRDDWQLYVCDAKPLAGILTSLQFDVLGYDHRLSGYEIEVVERPAVVGATMDIEYPSYMVDVQNAQRLPRHGEPVLASGNALPRGTHLTLHLTSSKPLHSAVVRLLNADAPSEDAAELEHQESTFGEASNTTAIAYEIPSLDASRAVEITLRDTDGVSSERAFRVYFNSLPDEAPRWELALAGIGTSITPDALIPLSGKVTDDYGVASVWLDATIGEGPPLRFDLPLAAGSQLTYSLDLRAERLRQEGFRLSPGDKFALLGHAVDRYNLAAQPNDGVSERYVLDVVTPDQLLVSLEARELALRRRFEIILEEFTAMRDSLLRVRPGEVATVDGGTEPLAALEPGEKQLSAEEKTRRDAELRLLRVQRALQQSKKSSQEVSGVAQAFDLIREELTNNRMDTEDRKSRLKEQVADPLHALVAQDFPRLDEQLIALEEIANDAQRGPAAAEEAILRTNALLAQLDQVLQKMLKLESFNEIVDIVRDLMKEQHALLDETKRQQRRDLEE